MAYTVVNKKNMAQEQQSTHSDEGLQTLLFWSETPPDHFQRGRWCFSHSLLLYHSTCTVRAIAVLDFLCEI